MYKKKFITAFATGALMLASLTPFASAATVNTQIPTSPVSSLTSTVNGLAQGTISSLSNLLGGNGVSTNTTANVTSTNGNTSASVSNQTGANVLGNTVNATTNVTTQLGL
jgi:hypothetical protein